MRVQAVAKYGGVWIPWHGELIDGNALELNVHIEFMCLTNTLFGGNCSYIPEKSDREILEEVLSVKYS